MDKVKLKVLVLDFDNCIALDENTRKGSEEIKDEAWFQIYPEYERNVLEPVLENAKKIVSGGKGDRKDIVEILCRHFGVPSDKISSEVAERCANFNRVIQEGIKGIPVSQRARDALAGLSRRVPLYVNTATPKDGVLDSLDALGLTHFFKEVLGRPGTKIANLNKIIAQESITPGELLFVDDQHSGWLTAQECGCLFAGIHTAKNNAWHSGDLPFLLIYSLQELLAMV